VLEPELKTDYNTMIELPMGVDEQEWIATHALALFHNVDHHYGVISELCTADSCPTMRGPGAMSGFKSRDFKSSSFII